MTLDEVLRLEGGQVLATLVRLTRDIGIAEDALQEAVITAHARWTDDDMPDNPAAWLTTTARNKALDRIRREARRSEKEREAVALLDQQLSEEPNEPTDLLRLLFTCCHPALAQEAQIALALRTLCGMTTTEIAAAFLVQDATMGQRISRAKKKIATAQIPYRVPDDHELPDRLPAVLQVLYLVFTTGHHAIEGSLDSRVDLATEAIRLCRMLAELMPDEPEVSGLLALMLATHARSHARLAPDGSIILLADQDRTLWDRTMIDEASVLVEGSLRQWAAGEYRIQAAIATLHGLAPSYAETDFEQIAELYRLLEAVKPTPVVRVNRAVAEAQVAGPQRGLELLEGVEGLDAWHLFWATKADFHRRLDEKEAAAAAYRRALECQMNQTDRAFLEDRLASVV